MVPFSINFACYKRHLGQSCHTHTVVARGKLIVVAHSLTFLLSMILGNKTRQVYWDINLRAAVGETILHLCFLNATRVHYDLSKMIIKRFPNLVNDIYLSDEYYGKFHEKK